MIFIDCESAGLRGETFACAMVNLNGDTVFNGYYLHPDLKTNEWLADNVAPNLNGEKYDTREEFLNAAAVAWIDNKGAAVAHMGSPVEANFFQLLYNEGFIGEFEGPYPLHDTATLLLANGYAPDSEIYFARACGWDLGKEMQHNAEFDAKLTRLVWVELT